MRFKFKWIVAIGLLLGIASIWWERSSSRRDLSGDELVDADTLKARAREAAGGAKTGGATVAVSVPTWQPAINQALTSGAPPADQAKNLLAQFPDLPPAGQFAAAHHISNLLPDESFGTWAGYLTNASIPLNVRGVIYADLMRRPNTVRLPMLLQVASSSAPQAGNAAQLLRATLRDDYGKDWDAWALRIQEWLKSHPDPARPGISGTSVGN